MTPKPRIWARLRPRDWRWWYWIIPSKRKIRRYLSKVEVLLNEILEKSLEENRMEIDQFTKNMVAYGSCAGEWSRRHGMGVDGIEFKVIPRTEN